MEALASLLPWKYLLRLKPLSTSWNSIISSDRALALTTDSNYSSPNLFLRQFEDYRGLFSLEKLQGGELRSGDASFTGPGDCDVVYGYCKGVLLLGNSYYTPTKYLLWNPTAGKMLDFHFPRQLYSGAGYGICYDPVTLDFKVVYITGAEYGVFSFKGNSWTEKAGLLNKGIGPGFYVDGILYWYCSYQKKTSPVMYFDPRSDQLKWLEKPKGLADHDDLSISLACLDDDLYLYCQRRHGTRVQVWVKEKGIFENCWKEFVTMENVEDSLFSFDLLCFMDGKMVVELEGERCAMYRFDEKTFEQVEDLIDNRPVCGPLIPYQETLLFPTPIPTNKNNK